MRSRPSPAWPGRCRRRRSRRSLLRMARFKGFRDPDGHLVELTTYEI